MQKNKTVILSVVFLVVLLSSCGVKARIKKADKKYDIGEYYAAANIYQSVYKQIGAKDKKTRAYVAFRQGECYRYINSPKAVNAYRNAIRYKYDNDTIYLHNAQVLQQQGKYSDAAKQYEIFLQAHPNDYIARGGLYACRQINEWKQHPSRYKIQLAKEFNAKRSSNFAPQFIGDDADALMFTSNRVPSSKKNQKVSNITGVAVNGLYTTRKNSLGKWEEIEPTEGIGNAEQDAEQEENDDKADESGGQAEKKDAVADFGVCCFTADGKTMYFTYSKPVNGQDLGAKIYRSDRASGTWGEPREVKIFEDSTITCGHPSLNHTGDTLYFVSDAPGGMGGKDIWYAVENNGEWIAPTNMGEPINTAGDELYPTIRKGGVLYFSSNGHPGYGGLDIFKAVPNDPNDSLQQPYTLMNMAMPFNSQGDDFGITFAGDTEVGFFSSNRGQKKGYDQIYSFYLPEMEFFVEGKVLEPQGEVLSDAVLRLVGDDGTIQRLQVKKDGSYKIKLKKDVQYVMLAKARGYLNQTEKLNTLNLTDSKVYTQDFMLAPISKPVTMDNVFYEFGKWDVTPQSAESLNGLVKLLQDNPNITIELSAHTDRVGNAESNKVLSEKRAQSVVNYLIERGIDKDRLTPVGYGKEKPVIADKAMHQKYSFIPVGQVLDEEFIDKLTKQQEEICNQINRRTEFKVLKTTYKLY